jgi:hypothetical protein
MILRRSAAVARKPLKFLLRRFGAAVAVAVCGGSGKVNKINVRRLCGGGWSGTPIPPMRFAAPCWRAPRAHQPVGITRLRACGRETREVLS